MFLKLKIKVYTIQWSIKNKLHRAISIKIHHLISKIERNENNIKTNCHNQ